MKTQHRETNLIRRKRPHYRPRLRRRNSPLRRRNSPLRRRNSPLQSQTPSKEKSPLQSQTPSKEKHYCNSKILGRKRPRCDTNYSWLHCSFPLWSIHKGSTPAPRMSLRRRETQNRKKTCKISCRMNSFLKMNRQVEETKLAPITHQETMRSSMKKPWKLELTKTQASTSAKFNPLSHIGSINHLLGKWKQEPFYHLGEPLTKEGVYAKFQKSKGNLDGPSMNWSYSEVAFACHEYLTCFKSEWPQKKL